MASRYQKLTQREHVLHRPDSYVGSVEPQIRNEWVYENNKIVKKDVSYSPALLKIFDEILTNSADCFNRGGSMDTLKVTIEPTSVTVWNNGCSIPIEKHETEKCYVPEMIFGHLLSGENFNDDEERTGAGRNGYGSKLTNVFSKHFAIEVTDGTKKYTQIWSDNMSVVGKPKITKCSKEPFISTTFFPDFPRFQMHQMDSDIISLMTRRVYDISASLGKAVKVFLNGKRLEVKSAEDYFSLYIGNKGDTKRAFESVGGWDVGVAYSDDFTAVSFVNSSVTVGGTHVNLVVDAIAKGVVEAAAKKKTVVKPALVKNKMFVFVNAKVANPVFSSQTKEILTSRNAKVSLSDTFIKKAVAILLDAVIAETNVRSSLVDEKLLKKTDGAKKNRITGIKKLTDAAWAGTKHSTMCTLILTEGDSAATLAISSLAIVGRERYGVFPLKGKLLNVRDASVASITSNAEITAIKQILGLQTGKTYKDTSSLRYGKILVMADADVDGSHILGLIMNFFHAQYPSLLEIPGFLKKFTTPIVIAKRGKDMKEFYSIPDFESWKTLTPDYAKWSCKYLKGLGTSTTDDAKRYFKNLKSLAKVIEWTDDSSELIDRSFNKTRPDERKKWLLDFLPGNQLDQTKSTIPVSDFINKELILFSRYDVERSIPSVMDGLKPSQRKILFSAFKRNLTSEIKVAQFSGYVSEKAGYHHGEVSLQGAIIAMAQDFVGSNNVNLLMPNGQFGSRILGGKDSASARYIFTMLSPIARTIFPKADDVLLKYLEDDGEQIEPEWYAPIIPFILVNGSVGIGTGFSTNIPSYDPKDIIANVKRLIGGDEMLPMTPWYRGFTGEIVEKDTGVFTCHGVSKTDGKTITITELPVGVWTNDYKEYLESLIEKKTIVDYREKHTDKNVHFEIDFIGVPDPKILKLESAIRETNMHAFDPSGRIKKYDSPLGIIRDWFETRRKFYVKRKKYLLKDLKNRAIIAANKNRFIMMINAGSLIVTKKAEIDIVAELNDLEFYKVDGKYDYLVDMKIASLTAERAEKLRVEAENLRADLEELEKTSERTMWLRDIDSVSS
jgi:DNA topoisomerase II